MKTILHLTPFFSPNIGGVETHLEDLVRELDKLGYINHVLTYSPITTTSVTWKSKERWGKNIFINRFNWIGHNLFHRLEKHPLINFFYITPYLFFRSFIWFIIHHRQIDVIHSHGINAALIGIFLQKIYRLPRHITSIYSSYDNVAPGPKIIKLMTLILNHTDKVLAQSKTSRQQLISFGVNPSKLDLYRHWIDLKQFTPASIPPKKFTVLFVGRMIKPKGAHLLLRAAKHFSQINFIFVGDGPELPRLKKISQNYSHINFIGNVPYQNLVNCYRQSSLFCIPSLYAEGWGRVIMEALACGLPVIATNRGAVPEVVDSTVSIIIEPTVKNIIESINKLYQNKLLYSRFKTQTVLYARKHFSSKNIRFIIRYY